MLDETIILKILKTHKITDYLAARGFSPVKISGDRISYKCPFPDHNETKPSFIVYTNSEFENFYCFGCGRSKNIINLVSVMEHIPLTEVVKKLGGGEISLEEELTLCLEILDRKNNISPDKNISQDLLSISSLCWSYLCSVNNNERECEIIDAFYQRIDKYIDDLDFSAIKECLIYLPDMLLKRRELFENRINKERLTKIDENEIL